MLRSSIAALRVALLLACIATATIGCSTSTTAGAGTSTSTATTGGAGGATTSSGAGGVNAGGASSGVGGAGGTASTTACPFPTPDATGADAGQPAQAWCDPATPNPADCPAAAPKPGSACATPGLQCAYERAADGFVLETCGDTWAQAARNCSESCAPQDGSVEVPAPAACDTLPDTECAGGPTATDQERAGRTLQELASCCHPPNESSLVVWMKDGCASAIAGPADVVHCVSALLAGCRLACAKSLTCLRAGWSTLP